ncbi:hypothetical protein TH66_01775 [Carbonactinospora thermoautotrophica]|uniref:Uncharacterized protein n=1 Tax=Carbonactinospora thermoautotrophica TaxID=1469144 RepID=A0A132NDV5_9ACTN|nr:hypothetical protein TH66_01775 [Carbonactinospora thermoautotrophica]KWX08166.1 hypothetical protein TR74_16175 [Carbonactinospora thermoautotrophica]
MGEQCAGVADLFVGQRRGPAEALAAGAGGDQAFVGGLDDEFADELGQGGEDVEDQPAAGGGGVQGLVQALEADAAAEQVRDQGDQVGQGAGEPVPAGDDEGVAGAQVVQAGRQFGPVGAFARELVGEHPDASGLGEGVDLAVQVLAGGGDPGVADERAGEDGRFGGELIRQAEGCVGAGVGGGGHARKRTGNGLVRVVGHPCSQHVFPTLGSGRSGVAARIAAGC